MVVLYTLIFPKQHYIKIIHYVKRMEIMWLKKKIMSKKIKSCQKMEIMSKKKLCQKKPNYVEKNKLM